MTKAILALSKRKAKRALRRDATKSATGEPATLDQIQQSVLSRLRRIEGQIRGIQGMVAGGTDCQDILVQVKAVRSALRATNGLILKRYLLGCQRKAMKNSDHEEALHELEDSVRLLSNYLDS